MTHSHDKTVFTRQEECCCCGEDTEDKKQNCMICGRPLHYFQRERMFECSICHQLKPGNAVCENGHFVCDECHSNKSQDALQVLTNSTEKDPVILLQKIFQLPSVHMHGPEHHSIVPAVLITAYHNCGGEIDSESSLAEAWKRGQKIAGGACGYLGVCGAAAGAGIFASIVSGATPLSEKEWEIPQRLTAECLQAMIAIGGPRCCKRTSRIAIACAAEFSAKYFHVEMPVSRTACGYFQMNRECIRERCPFYPKKKNPEV